MDITKHQNALNHQTKELTSIQLEAIIREKEQTATLRRQVRRIIGTDLTPLNRQALVGLISVNVRVGGVNILMAAYPATKSWHENEHYSECRPYWSTLVSVEGHVIETLVCPCHEIVTENPSGGRSRRYRRHIDTDYHIVDIDELSDQQLRDIFSALSKLEKATPKPPRLGRRIWSRFLNH